MPAKGPIDLVAAFTRPLPFQVIADVLGVPADHQNWLSEAMETFGRAVAGQRDHANVELGNAAAADMLSYFEQALADRAEHPREDVLSLLAAEPSDAEARADLRANCIFFILAGHVTTTALLSAGVHLLAEHPTQLAQLLASPAGWPAAVEELLRFVSPTTLTGTTASVDAEADGCPVPAGQQRILIFAAANRTPRSSPAPTTSMSRAHRTRTSHSRRAATTASERRWPGCMPRSPCQHSSPASQVCVRSPRPSGWEVFPCDRSRCYPSSGTEPTGPPKTRTARLRPPCRTSVIAEHPAPVRRATA